MSTKNAGQIQEIGGRIEQSAGADTRKAVMVGADKASKSTDSVEVALWVKAAIDRLDKLVSADAGAQIMGACGHNCIAVNSGVLKRAQARRAKYPSEEAFLRAEARKPPSGTRLELSEKLLTHYYTPRSFGKGMRCYCGLMRGLPEDTTASRTYCQCSRGFVERYWEGILGRPVRVDLGATALTGARECQFTIYL